MSTVDFWADGGRIQVSHTGDTCLRLLVGGRYLEVSWELPRHPNGDDIERLRNFANHLLGCAELMELRRKEREP